MNGIALVILTDVRMIWGIIPDFWSISGSGLILGGAIWVAVAKSRVKLENHDDLERNEYLPVGTDEEHGKDEFELGEISDAEETAESSSSPQGSPTEERRNRREVEDLNIPGVGERV